MLKYTPLGDIVVISRIEQPESTESGLILPDSSRESRYSDVGRVVAVGPEVTRVHRGNIVVFSRYAGSTRREKIDDRTVVVTFLQEKDILAVIEDEEVVVARQIGNA